jgi:hypothetical protein
MPAVNVNHLLKDLPRGEWAAISRRESKVVAHGTDLRDVLRQAAEHGEPNPLVVKVPESSNALVV